MTPRLVMRTDSRKATARNSSATSVSLADNMVVRTRGITSIVPPPPYPAHGRSLALPGERRSAAAPACRFGRFGWRTASPGSPTSSRAQPEVGLIAGGRRASSTSRANSSADRAAIAPRNRASAAMKRRSPLQPVAQGANRAIRASPPPIAIDASGTIISRPKPSARAPRNHQAERRPQAAARIIAIIGQESGNAARFARLNSWAGAVAGLALTRLEAAVRLVDDIGPAAAADDSAVPVARFQRLQAIANLHGRAPASFSQFTCCRIGLEDRRLT